MATRDVVKAALWALIVIGVVAVFVVGGASIVALF
jgi:hypothetical protein